MYIETTTYESTVSYATETEFVAACYANILNNLAVTDLTDDMFLSLLTTHGASVSTIFADDGKSLVWTLAWPTKEERNAFVSSVLTHINSQDYMDALAANGITRTPATFELV